MRFHLHVHGDAHGSQVAHTHDAANDISSEVIKNQDFPDRVAIGIENRCHRGEEAICKSLFTFTRVDRFVEIENLFQRS